MTSDQLQQQYTTQRDAALAAMSAERRELVLRYELCWVERPDWSYQPHPRAWGHNSNHMRPHLWPMVSVVPGGTGYGWRIKWNDPPTVRGYENARYDDTEYDFVLDALEAADAWLHTATRLTQRQVDEMTRNQRVIEFRSELTGVELARALAPCCLPGGHNAVTEEPYRGGTRWWLGSRYRRDLALTRQGDRWCVATLYPDAELIARWRERLRELRVELLP